MVTQYGQPRSQSKLNAKKGSSAERRDRAPEAKPADPSPPKEVVDKFHANASVDVTPSDIHHRLGGEANQASPGDHSHDGGSSKLLLEGYTIVGAKSSPSLVLPSIIAALVRLGAKDSTT